MKKLTKTLSAILCITLLFTNLSVIKAEEIETSAENNSYEADLLETPEISSEIAEYRSSDEKHFRMSDGSCMAVKYSVPVHYEEDGEWKEIDNTLVSPAPLKENIYTNKSSSFNVTFADSIKDPKLVKIRYKDHEISWKYLQDFSVSDRMSMLNFNEAGMANVINSIDLQSEYESEDIEQKNEAVIDNAASTISQ